MSKNLKGNRNHIGSSRLGRVVRISLFVALLAACNPTAEDPVGAEWVNLPSGVDGSIRVAWGMNDAGEEIVGITATAPLQGIYTGQQNVVFNNVIKRLGGNTFIRFECPTDEILVRGLMVSQGTQEVKDFPGDSNSGTMPGSHDLVAVGPWVLNNCRQSFAGHTDEEREFPVSFETTCRKADGSEYPTETVPTLQYKVLSTCQHLAPPA